jgi:hypothetical protein
MAASKQAMRQVRNDGMAVSSEKMAWQALRLFSRIGRVIARIIVDAGGGGRGK